MSRSTSFLGLSPAAEEFLKNNALPETREICKCCKQPKTGKNIPIAYDRTYGMFEEEYPLFRFALKDGSFAHEFVQASPWASGPCIFTALMVSSVPIERYQLENKPKDTILGQVVGAWTDAEIEANI